jgi:AcrR family transcriptional regulator
MPRPRARIDPAAVIRAFAPDGLHGATSEEIARCAGVAKPTVYAHGGSKEAIFLACVEAEVERLLSELARADLESRALPARGRISALARAILDHARAYPSAARLLFVTARHTASRVAEDVDAALERLPARLASILRRDTTPACADRLAPALLGAAAALALRGAAAKDVERAAALHRDTPPQDGAALLGEAFAAALDPVEDAGVADRVQSVGLY